MRRERKKDVLTSTGALTGLCDKGTHQKCLIQATKGLKLKENKEQKETINTIDNCVAVCIMVYK